MYERIETKFFEKHQVSQAQIDSQKGKADFSLNEKQKVLKPKVSGLLLVKVTIKDLDLEVQKNQITTQRSGCDLKRSCDRMSEK